MLHTQRARIRHNLSRQANAIDISPRLDFILLGKGSDGCNHTEISYWSNKPTIF